MHIKLGRMMTNLEGLLPMMLLYSLITWSCEIIWQSKVINMSTTTVRIETKFGRMVNNIQRFLPIMLLYFLVAWSCKIGGEIKTSALPSCLWPPKLAGVWLTVRGFIHKVTWPLSGITISYDKQKLYLSTTAMPMTAKFGRMVN